MAVRQVDYEEILAACSQYDGALSLLKQHRPYLETLPSMRRPAESIVTIPLPNVRVRQVDEFKGMSGRRVVSLPCDVALIMCDPEWKIKTGVEIFVLIHRPDEDFSDLLSRWRQSQRLLEQGYEWMLPSQHEHLLNEGAEQPRPLFVVFPQTPQRIIRGLTGAGLPVIVHCPHPCSELDEQARAAQSAAQPVETGDAETPLEDGSLDVEVNWEGLDDSLGGQT